jgi:xylan 1,4-beta-xylosidase
MTIGSRLLFLVGLTGSIPLAHAAEVAPVQVTVDATRPGAPIERVWPFYGFDEVNYTTTPEGVALLRTLVASNSADVYVRSHFLLNTGDGQPSMKWGSTNVYSEDALGNPLYDFALTNGIFDAIIAAGARPLVEIGFMPQALSTQPEPYRNSETLAVDGGCFYPPSDYAKWGELIRSWAQHANARYPGVAANWLWELWNEPDVNYWRGSFDEYAKLYDFTEAALHRAIPAAALGGPAVASPQRPFLEQFLEHCASGTNAVTGAVGTRLDLVSFHSKGGVFLDGDHVTMDLGNQLRLHRLGFSTVASFPEFQRRPIYITEADPDACAACPLSSNPGNAYRMSTAYGAYELSMMKRSLELEAESGVNLRGVLTWAFTFPNTPYFAGYRVLSTNGIQLPVLGAFQLLGKLSGARLPLQSSGALPLDAIITEGVHADPDIDGMASVDGGTVRILLWCYHDEIAQAPDTRVQLSIQLPGSFGANAEVEHLRVDQAHGDAYTLWLAQGSPPNPNAEQISALERAMVPSRALPEGIVPVLADGSVSLDVELPRHAVTLLTLRKATVTNEPSSGDERSGCACSLPGSSKGTNSMSFFAAAIGLGCCARRRFARRSIAKFY